MWKDIVEFEGLYQVNECGEVRSLDRVVPFRKSTKRLRGKTLKGKVDKYGYKIYSLSKNSKHHMKPAHRLVAIHFIESKDNKPQVNHIDGNKLNNNVSNLEWVTTSENAKHAFRIGLHSLKGEKNNMAKLTEGNVLEIRRLYETTKITQYKLAEKFGVSQATINDVICKRCWVYL